VLPFVNMSGDREQEYFSDGLTEELLNSLARINNLQVAARTSAFSFKGKDTDIGTIARRLNVGAVLEGSVRRSGQTVRITAELISGVTGFHLWSQSYDRNLGEILALQSEIANAVASALKVNLLGDVAAKVELGGGRETPQHSMPICAAARLTMPITVVRTRKLHSLSIPRRFAWIRNMRSHSRTELSR
jgi:TolB-like protein